MSRLGVYMCSAAATALIALTAPVSVRAQEASYNFNILAGDLGSGLRAYAQATRQQVAFEETLVRGKYSAPVVGSLASDKALILLLAGTGLTAQRTRAGVILIIPIRAADRTNGYPDGGGPALLQPAAVQTSAAVPSTGGVASKPPSDPPAPQLQEIVVSGSRIMRPGFTAPTPITTVDAAQIASSGVGNIADLLNQVPSFRPTVTSTSADSRPFAPGSNYADLRGFGSTRTLVLVNGERVVPEVPNYSSAITNQVDLNIFPTIAITRTDVVTGGASAAWGSDALAGVVNLILYKHYQGVLVDASYGESQRSDNRDYHVGVLAGSAFQGGRGHVTVAAEYDNNEGIGDLFTRNWGKSGAFTLANTVGAGGCSTCYVSGTGYQYSSYAPGGLITSGPLKGTAFGPGGAPYSFNYGVNPNNSTTMFGGGVPDNSPQAGVYLEPPVKRENVYAFGDYEITSRILAHIQVNLAQSSAKVNYQPDTATFSILSGNPYIPASVQSQMTADHLKSIAVSDYATDIGRNTEDPIDTTVRISAGFNWDIGHAWTADGYYEYGMNYDDQKFGNAIIVANENQAINAVSAGGQVVCAVQTNGCAPLDVFGLGSASAAARKFILGSAFDHIRYQQQVAAANIRGNPFETWAGPVSFAVGVEHRDEAQEDKVDSAQNAGVFKGSTFGFQNPDFEGRVGVTDIYGETVVPVIKDFPFIKEFDVNGAIRYSSYSTIGQVDTWKIGGTLNITSDLLFRVTDSRDIRAPNISELYYPETLSSQTTAISGQTQLAAQLSGGNPNLKAEVAQSTTGGLTYSPSAVPGLRATLDYFAIDLNNAITAPSGPTVVANCNAGLAAFCALETKSGGIVTQYDSIFVNLSNLTTHGLDVEISYASPLARFFANIPGSVNFRILGTYTEDLRYQLGAGTPNLNHAGQNSSGVLLDPFYAPTFKGSFSMNYGMGPYSVTAIVHYISAGVENTALTTAQFPGNNIPAYETVDLSGSYSFGKAAQYQVFGVINNLFDVSPPIVAGGATTIPTNPAFYDVIGRSFKMGFRLKY